MNGPRNVRMLNNMHGHALKLAILGHETGGITTWQEIVDRCHAIKAVRIYHSMAGIAEFRSDVAMAEVFYTRLIILCEAMHPSEHIHGFDYRRSHAEQIMRQGKLKEVTRLSEAMLASRSNTSEWRIRASCLQTTAACCNLRACYTAKNRHMG